MKKAAIGLLLVVLFLFSQSSLVLAYNPPQNNPKETWNQKLSNSIGQISLFVSSTVSNIKFPAIKIPEVKMPHLVLTLPKIPKIHLPSLAFKPVSSVSKTKVLAAETSQLPSLSFGQRVSQFFTKLNSSLPSMPSWLSFSQFNPFKSSQDLTKRVQTLEISLDQLKGLTPSQRIIVQQDGTIPGITSFIITSLPTNTTFVNLLGNTIIDSFGDVYPSAAALAGNSKPSLGIAGNRYYGIYANKFTVPTAGLGSGYVRSDTDGLLSTASQVSLSTDIRDSLGIGNGGTGITTSPTNGQLLIGNTSTNGFTLSTLTQGSNVTITNANGAITIAASSSSGPLTETAQADGFTIAGGTTSRTLTVTGANITIGSTIQPTAAGTLSIQSNGANGLTLDTGGAAAINIGNTNTNGMNIGTGATVKTIAIGTATAATADVINIGNTQTGGSISIGNAMTGGTIAIGGGTATRTANITIGSTNTTSGVLKLIGGTGTGAFGGATSGIDIIPGVAGTINIGASGGAGTGAITLGQSTATNTISIGSGITGATNTQTVNIANGAGAGTAINVSILSGVGTAGTGTLALGNNTRVTTIGLGNIAPIAARTISIGATGAMTPGVVDLINIGTGAGTVAGAETINIGSGTPTGSGTNLITIGSVAATANTTIIQGGNATTNAIQLLPNIAGGIMIGATAGTGTITLGQATGATNTINIGNGAINGFTQNIAIGTAATGTGVDSVTIGGIVNASAVTINSGTGNINLVPTGTGAIIKNNSLKSVVLTSGVLGTTATEGFVYIPTSAGAPTGVPTTQTGTVAMEYDTTNNFLYFYNAGWKKSTVYADWAEWAPAAGAGIGDVVVITSQPNPIDDPTAPFMLARSGSSYSPNIVGVVSKYAEEANQANGDRKSADYHAIALAGRVPVNVSTENGAIVAGDYLTSSSVPGVAMKATRAGYTLGKATQGYSGDGVGQIIAFIEVGYVDPSQFQLTLTPGAALVNEIGAGGLTILGPAEFKSETIFDKLVTFLTNVIFKGDVFFFGRATFNKDTAGLAVINQGADSVSVAFDREYASTPFVNATPTMLEGNDGAGNSILNGNLRYVVQNLSTRGFTIKLNQAAPANLSFSWTAIAVNGAGTSVSGAATSVPQPSVEPLVVPVSTPEPTAVPEPTVLEIPNPSPVLEPIPTEVPLESPIPSPAP